MQSVSTFISLFLSLSIAGAALAGSMVTFVLHNGEGGPEKVRAEVLGFGDGRFRVRNPDTNQRAEVPLDRVLSIHFEAEGERVAATLPDVQALADLAYTQKPDQLRAAYREALANGRRDLVAQVAARLAEMESQLDRKSAKREALLLAQWAAFSELGDVNAAQAVRQRLAADFPPANPEGVPAAAGKNQERAPKRDRSRENGDRVRDTRSKVDTSTMEGRTRDGR